MDLLINKGEVDASVFHGVDPAWTSDHAHKFVTEVLGPRLAIIGMAGEIVGSVQTKGVSYNDLDIKLKPLQVMTLDSAMDALEREIIPALCADRDGLGPHEGADYGGVETWFFCVWLEDGRLVELYLPADEFIYQFDLDDDPSASMGM